MDGEEAPAFRRANGFQWPLHPLQVLSWVVVSVDVGVFACLCVPALASLYSQVFVGILYIVSIAVLIYGAAQATRINPADQLIYKEEPTEEEQDAQSLLYCTLCSSFVYPRSKHCITCGKCVTIFDHHCKWLNNCIGQNNYRAFVVTILAAIAVQGVSSGTCTHLVINRNLDDQGRWDWEWDRTTCFLVSMLAVNVPLLLLLVQLVLFHAFLRWRNMTTYEYISMKRRKQMETKEEKAKTGDDPGTRHGVVLPRCLDWIVFSKSRRNRLSSAKIERKVKKSKSEEKQKKKVAEASIEEAPLKDNPDSPGQPDNAASV